MSTSEVAIRAEGLSKLYRIGRKRSGRSFREALTETIAAPFRRSTDSPDEGEFWALKDVSFEIKRGEVVGIIGRNGAGKSTLLKILSRITEPTSGIAQVYGRVGSLLEVGTGFHPELTGRENVYLNGAILGMKRREIDRQFDEIVDFAEVAKFIDTPVKHYSSGMYVRLAFAVAAHLEPEILIVDEVLAVGDAAFQRKCLGKMDDVASEGKSVLLVSHSMAVVQKLCDRAIVLSNGTVESTGRVDEAISSYLNVDVERSSHGRYVTNGEPTSQIGYIAEAIIESGGKFSSLGYRTGRPLDFKVRCKGLGSGGMRRPAVGIGIDDALGQRITTLHSSTDEPADSKQDSPSDFSFACRISDLALSPGHYYVKLSLESGRTPVDVIDRACYLEILDADFGGTSAKQWRGVVLCRQKWEYLT